MIKIVPSMAIQGGKVVKTIGGNVDEVKVYDKNPLDQAFEFEEHGITRLHLIDIDGARQRRVINYHILETLASYTNLEIDFTGGITTDGDVRTAFDSGAKYVTIATEAVHNREKFSSWLISYGNKAIILAADAKDGIVYTKGWKSQTGIDLMEHIEYYYERGVRRVKSTEIARDGSMKGPAFEMYQQILDRFPDLHILASGGVRGLEDIEALEKMGVSAVIIAKSLYEGRIELSSLKRFAQPSEI